MWPASLRSESPKTGSSTAASKRTSATISSSSPWGRSVTRSPSTSNQQAGDLGRALAGLALLGGLVVDQLAEVDLVVHAPDLVRVADLQHLAALDQHRAVGELLDQAHVVGHQQDRLALGLEAAEDVEALLLEGGVADGQHLVDQQHLGVDLGRDREAESHRHARGVVLELEVDELLQLGEGDDLVEALARLGAREAHHHRVDDDVVARGEVGVEADAELDERRQPALHAHLAAVGPVDAGEALQQRALARAVAADDAEELALLDGDVDVAQRVELLERARAAGMQHPLLERVVLLVRDAERLRDVVDDDGRRGLGQHRLPLLQPGSGLAAHGRRER